MFAFDHGIGLAITGGAGRLVAQLRQLLLELFDEPHLLVFQRLNFFLYLLQLLTVLILHIGAERAALNGFSWHLATAC